MKKLFLAVLCCLFWSGAVQAKSVYCTNCSNTATQAIQKALESESLSELKSAYEQYVKQTEQQIRMVQQNVEQYANMLQNTAKLPANLVSQVSSELSKLSRITSALNTLRNDVKGISGVFDQLYRTKDEFKNLANMPKELMSGSGGVGKTYEGYWDDWSDRVDKSTKATFQLSASQLKDLEQSGQLEAYINQLLSTPDGQQKAIMAGNQLAALQIQESRQLRELVATKFQSDLASQEKAEKESQFSAEMVRGLSDFSKINTKPVQDKGY